MIGHQAIRPDVHAVPGTCGLHQVEVDPVIFLPQKGGHTPVRPLRDVMGLARSYDSSKT
jgi:hypothetical protein